jgi:cytochrome c oxidase subunit 1
MEWDTLNLVTSIGAGLIALSFLLLAVNVLLSFTRGRVASANPWNAAGLEWSVASPPPPYNFALTPYVDSRTPLWTNGNSVPAVTGLRVDQKEVLVTSIVDAKPDMRDPVPAPSLWPFISAVVTTVVLIASIYTPQSIPWGAVPFAIVLIAWLYPRRATAPHPDELPREASP